MVKNLIDNLHVNSIITANTISNADEYKYLKYKTKYLNLKGGLRGLEEANYLLTVSGFRWACY